MTDKKMLPGELRFVTKKIDKGFRVYDRARGSFPFHSPELGGEVQQDHQAEEAAAAECARLNTLVASSRPPDKSSRKSKKPGPTQKTQTDPEPETVQADEVEDGGQLGEMAGSSEEQPD